MVDKSKTQNSLFTEAMWAGSETSLAVAVEAMRAIAGRTDDDEDEDEELPRLLSIHDNIGVITIRGPLVNSDSSYLRYYGLTGYPEIREALVHAAQDPRVEGILLDIESGGGAVSGVSDTGSLVSTVNRQFKPVWAVADGTMASAAYWLGSSAGKVFASNTSLVGSIGVISTHMEFSKAYKDEGVGVTVLRAGKYKTLANTYEPLSEEGKAQIQSHIDAAYQVFLGHVAIHRGVGLDVADQRMGQGRVFFGHQAQDAGLVDAILPFDEVVGRLNSELLDRSSATQNNNGNHHEGYGMTRRALTQNQIAAAAAGVPNPAAEATTEDAATTTAAEPSANEPQAPEASAPEASAPGAADAPVVRLLQEQLAQAQDRHLQLSIELNAVKGKLDAQANHVEGLKGIAARSLSTMKVALGHSAVDASAMSVETLLSEHTATAEAFQKAFKVGGVSVTPAENTSAESDAPTNQALQRARLAAVRVQP